MHRHSTTKGPASVAAGGHCFARCECQLLTPRRQGPLEPVTFFWVCSFEAHLNMCEHPRTHPPLCSRASVLRHVICACSKNSRNNRTSPSHNRMKIDDLSGGDQLCIGSRSWRDEFGTSFGMISTRICSNDESSMVGRSCRLKAFVDGDGSPRSPGSIKLTLLQTW